MYCTLEALTPFLINDGKGLFIKSRKTQQPFIPATTLKGMTRVLAELVGNACVPFPKVTVDSGHRIEEAAVGEGATRKLDPAARTFGYLYHRQVFAGLVQFGDGHLEGKLPKALVCQIAVGQPKITHRPFYPGDHYRKLYHHQVGATNLTRPHPGITQTSTVHPLPPGVIFSFRVDFANLRPDEFNLLLYCLVLEEEATVTLSKEASGSNEGKTLRGPLRHKLGHCKPHGGGSVHIRIDQMELRPDPQARYRGEVTSPQILEGETLKVEIQQRTQFYCQRQDSTMQHLRAMLIYTRDDPRSNINYPTYGWFEEDEGTKLKPTL